MREGGERTIGTVRGKGNGREWGFHGKRDVEQGGGGGTTNSKDT